MSTLAHVILVAGYDFGLNSADSLDLVLGTLRQNTGLWLRLYVQCGDLFSARNISTSCVQEQNPYSDADMRFSYMLSQLTLDVLHSNSARIPTEYHQSNE
jgi:hypothetical protein